MQCHEVFFFCCANVFNITFDRFFGEKSLIILLACMTAFLMVCPTDHAPPSGLLPCRPLVCQPLHLPPYFLPTYPHSCMFPYLTICQPLHLPSYFLPAYPHSCMFPYLTIVCQPLHLPAGLLAWLYLMNSCQPDCESACFCHQLFPDYLSASISICLH